MGQQLKVDCCTEIVYHFDMKQFYLGIDPGVDGAASLIGGDGKFVCGQKFMGDPCLGLLGVFTQVALSDLDELTVCLEKVHASPGAGVSSMFTFGEGFGKIQGWLYAMGITPQFVSPQTWQRWLPYDKMPKVRVRLGCEATWGLTPFMFPKCRVPHQGLMDATAIAEYFRLVDMGHLEAVTQRAPTKRRASIKLV